MQVNFGENIAKVTEEVDPDEDKEKDEFDKKFSAHEGARDQGRMYRFVKIEGSPDHIVYVVPYGVVESFEFRGEEFMFFNKDRITAKIVVQDD